jgi:hypothetical protein
VATETTETRARGRNRYSFASMGLSLGIVVAIVVVLVVLLPRPHYNAVKEINPAESIASAQRVASYHVLVPTNMPSTWRATSAGVSGPDEHHVVHLHIGYYTPQEHYAAIEEANADRVAFIELETSHGKGRGSMTIGADVWEKTYSSNQKQNSLIRTTSDGATVIVTGSAGYDELAVLAASLR